MSSEAPAGAAAVAPLLSGWVARSTAATTSAMDVVTLPDFRNFGVILRLVLIAEAASLATLVAAAPDGFAALRRVTDSGALFEVSLLVVVLLLFVGAHWLGRLAYRTGVGAIVGGVAAVVGAVHLGARAWIGVPTGGVLESAVLAALLAVVILAYFNWRQRTLSPALSESRSMALQARIRPHFLFNSLNAAISVVRQDPKRAEEVLLDMSDLFRVVLAEPRALVPLEKEIAVTRAYLAIEHLRLGDRLRVRWECSDAPLGTMVPVLMLQPLAENAVWHGVEPAAQPVEITIRIDRRDRFLRIEVSNPVPATSRSNPNGNRIALANIAERLALHFDAEGQVRAAERNGQFVVRLRLPLMSQARSNARGAAPQPAGSAG